MSLHEAQRLVVPGRVATLRRDLEVSTFWRRNTALLKEAWSEWEDAERARLPVLDASLIDRRLRDAVDTAWKAPESEDAVRDLWQPVAPGVYQAPFFDPTRLGDLRAFMDAASNARIPVRPPYGIVLNRRGAMLDRRSDGHLASPAFQRFYRTIVDHYFRPISRLLFPETVGFDSQSFGFSITWLPTEDTSIRPHTDASSTTLNLNLNLPDERFEGSSLEFYDPRTGRARSFVFEPGTAVLHRGSVAHAARPITEGARTNFVLWLYGEGGRVPPRSLEGSVIEPRLRWKRSTIPADGHAPF